MRIRKIAAAVVPLIATATFGAATVHAAPPAAAPDIGYRTELVGNTVVTTLTHGTFAVAGGTVDVIDESGATVLTLPLSVREGSTEYPLPHAVREEGRVLELIAVKDPATARPAAEPVASPQENLAAQDNLTSQIGLASAIGGFIGTVVGAVAGLLVAAGSGVGIPAIPAAIVTGAALGGVIGTIVVGGPTLIIAAVDLVSTLTAPPGTTRWAGKN